MASTTPSGSKRKEEAIRTPSAASLSKKKKAVIPWINVYFAKATPQYQVFCGTLLMMEEARLSNLQLKGKTSMT